MRSVLRVVRVGTEVGVSEPVMFRLSADQIIMPPSGAT